MDFSEQVSAANARLADRRCKCRIELRKKALVLRATLPDKEGLSPPKQQRLPIGAAATGTGLADAELKAMQLDSDLRNASFNWSEWIGGETESGQRQSVAHEEFVSLAKALHERKVKKKSRKDPRAVVRGQEGWRKRWAPALSKLPTGLITEKKLLGVVRSLEEGTACRRETALVLGMVAAELGWNQKAIREAGMGYGRRMLRKRDIPTDAEIEAAFDRLLAQSPHWARVWGLVATYGARPSELGTATLRADGVLIVEDSKTNKSRAVTPTKTAWVERFQLQALPPPPGKRDGYAISTNANAARRRAGIDIQLYSLRHAAAIRLLAAGVPAELAAKLMGHSAAMFNDLYTLWISEETIIGMMANYKL